VFVACSTLCFSKQPLSQALRTIGELGFSKVDLAVEENGTHLKPSAVAADVAKAAQMLRHGPGLAIAALHIEFAGGLSRDNAAAQMKALCRLARVLSAPLASVSAAPTGTDLAAEVERLGWLNRVATAEGVTLAVETRIGTLTEDPAVAVELCEKVPGLGLALDPSHYLVGPHHSQQIDMLYPYVQHVRLRDTNSRTEQFQVRVGQGEIEYGRIVNQLARFNYGRMLSVDIRDQPEPPFEMPPEVRKLKYLLESLI
jgi:sugar phosphate isomerase/epimerase